MHGMWQNVCAAEPPSGKTLSIFRGAVSRAYRGTDFARLRPRDHPAAFREPVSVRYRTGLPHAKTEIGK